MRCDAMQVLTKLKTKTKLDVPQHESAAISEDTQKELQGLESEHEQKLKALEDKYKREMEKLQAGGGDDDLLSEIEQDVAAEKAKMVATLQDKKKSLEAKRDKKSGG